MDKSIKIRNAVKDIKALDKKAVLSSGIRGVHAKTKEVVDRPNGWQQVYQHGEDYAQAKIEQSVSNAVDAEARGVAKGAKAAAKTNQVAARNTAHAARASTKAAVAAIRAAAKGITVFAKMAIVTVKSLVSIIAAGGKVAVAVILVICLVGLIVTSAIGIFFAGDDMGDGNPSLREVIVESNDEHA